MGHFQPAERGRCSGHPVDIHGRFARQDDLYAASVHGYSRADRVHREQVRGRASAYGKSIPLSTGVTLDFRQPLLVPRVSLPILGNDRTESFVETVLPGFYGNGEIGEHVMQRLENFY